MRLALFWGIGLTGFLGCVVSTALVLSGEEGSPLIRNRSCGIQVGRNSPLFWLVPDSKVLGGEMYLREIREFLIDRSAVSFVIVQDARQIPNDADVVVVCGEADDAGRRGRRKTIWLSPRRTDVEPGKTQLVVIGALSIAAAEYGDQGGVIIVDGSGDYIPDWLRLLYSNARSSVPQEKAERL